jgi:hypothetical protein
MVSKSEAMKPPRLASDLLNVPMIRWTSSVSPKWLAVPAHVTTQDADAMRIVHHHGRLVFPSETT